MTKIMPCTCANPFQDRTYGPGKRLHNAAKEGRWRCTVCGNTKGAPKPKAKEEA